MNYFEIRNFPHRFGDLLPISLLPCCGVSPKMGLSTPCVTLSSRFLHPENFGTRSSSSSVGFSKVSVSQIIYPQCRALGQSDSNAPQQRISADDNPFVKPLSKVYSVIPCRFCLGSGKVKCDVCDGQGSLARGGFHKRNLVAIERIVGSNWTAMERTFGRHHFYVHSKRREPGKDWFLEMVSACDETTRFWINAKILKDRERWSAGWLQRGELHGIKDETLWEEAKTTICKACKGCRTQPCQMCAKSEGGLLQSRELDIIDV